MIELNLTYEESKKILELGYDFSRVCDFAWVSLDEVRRPVLACQNSGTQYLLSGKKICDFQTALIPREPIEIIPIIPKAALEACLPDFLCVKDFYGELDRSRFVKKLCNGMIYLNSQDSERVSHEWFRTAFEAFIWCHENYPEELREKFEEVMR